MGSRSVIQGIGIGLVGLGAQVLAAESHFERDSVTGVIHEQTTYRFGKSSDLFIVEVQGKPLAELIANGRQMDPVSLHRELKVARAALKSRRHQVQHALRNLVGHHLKVRWEFDVSLHGFSVRMNPVQAAQLEKHPQVVRVSAATSVKIPEESKPQLPGVVDSVPQSMLPPLGIPDVWKSAEVRGEGIRIAILDTGIDYRHPDLGGCFGPECKVIGGYDFANGDGDPMDGNGHGTHVAGIAAANGRKMGAAPEARLLAYKVLSDIGVGSSDSVIAGIDRALDPDGTSSGHNRAHVINLSLGGLGTPTDPLAMAVNRAARIVPVVCAVGNAGVLRTIGSPAGAQGCITTAASSGESTLASFSNIGPTSSFTLKPDVTAPGVDIWSTVTGGYARYSGTSMAAPLIAGIIALLNGRRMFNAMELKTLFGHTSTDLSDVAQLGALQRHFYQGVGLVNPAAVLRTPENLSVLAHDTYVHQTDLGIHSLAKDELVALVTIDVSYANPDGMTRFEVSIEHDFGKEAQVMVYPQEVFLGVHDINTKIFLSMWVPTDDIPVADGYPRSSGLFVKLTDSHGVAAPLKIPVTFFPKAEYRLIVAQQTPDGGGPLIRGGHLIPHAGGPTIRLLPAFDEDPNRPAIARVFVDPGRYVQYLIGANTRGDSYDDPVDVRLFVKDVHLDRGFTQSIDADDFPFLHQPIIKDPDGIARRDLYPRFQDLSPRYGDWTYGTDLIWDVASVRSNALPDNWTATLAASWQDGADAIFAGARLRFWETFNRVFIPRRGYHKTELAFDHHPKYLCHVTAPLRVGVLSKPTLSTNLHVGVGDWLTRAAWTVWAFRRNHGDGMSCWHNPHRELLSLHFSNTGRSVMKDRRGFTVLRLPNPLPMDQGFSVMTGYTTVGSGGRIRARMDDVTSRFGLLVHQQVDYALKNLATGEVLGSGSSAGDGSDVSWSTVEGRYELVKKLEIDGKLQTQKSVFTVSETPDHKLVPGLERLYWERKEVGWLLAVKPHLVDGSEEIRKVALRTSDEQVLEETAQGSGVWQVVMPFADDDPLETSRDISLLIESRHGDHTVFNFAIGDGPSPEPKQRQLVQDS